MGNLAISTRGLGKQYRLGELEPYRALRDVIASAATAPARWLRGNRTNGAAAGGPDGARGGSDDKVWALRNATFEIAPGEVVGIIGRNGAGKSTLLKLLSRITQPTEGDADIYGSVGSLLEVGTGFHPELTGRENVYLNGAILGMSRTEIERKFDEIVAFADVERFIDTPVKRFSSGMQVRLAFAVAAHLEPDILLVDEVLAVGDVEFQKKCMGRMEDVSALGRTVLFVSHSMPAILRLCPRVILLDRGGVVADGPARDVIRTYLESGLGTSAAREWQRSDAPGDDVAKLRSVRVLDASGQVAHEVDVRRSITIEVEYWRDRAAGAIGPGVGLTLTNEDGVVLFGTSDLTDRSMRDPDRRTGLVRSICHIPAHFLAEGQVLVDVAIASMNPVSYHCVERDVVAFHGVDRVADSGSADDLDLPVNWPGVIRPKLEWDVEVTHQT
jgi:lipopolysaccharide transport system ATP-binding protein